MKAKNVLHAYTFELFKQADDKGLVPPREKEFATALFEHRSVVCRNGRRTEKFGFIMFLKSFFSCAKSLIYG